MRKAISFVCLSLGALLPLEGASAAEPGQKALLPDSTKTLYGERHLEVAKQLHAARRNRDRGHGISIRPASFTPPPSPKVAVIVDAYTDKEGSGIDGEIWLCDLPTGNPKYVLTEPATYLHAIEGSPDGNYLAYVGEPFPPRGRDELWDNTALWIVNAKNGRKTLIADGGAAFPTWTADSSELLFVRRTGESRDPLIGEKSWRPYRATSLPQEPKLEPASDLTTVAKPGVFSRDGQLAIGSGPEGLIVEALATGQRSTLPPLPGRMRLQGAQWSWDSQWVCLAMAPYGLCATFSLGPLFHHVLFQPATGKSVPLEEAIGSPDAEKDSMTTTELAPTWIPGRGHRLLIRAGTTVWDAYRQPIKEKSTHRWLIYDVDANTTRPVEPRAAPPGFIRSWCADGRHVLVGQYSRFMSSRNLSKHVFSRRARLHSPHQLTLRLSAGRCVR